MKLIIDIPEERLNSIKRFGIKQNEVCMLESALISGTTLPKGHGRLIDADRLRSMYSINRANFNTVVGIQKWIDNAPTIIEADMRGEKDGNA